MASTSASNNKSVLSMVSREFITTEFGKLKGAKPYNFSAAFGCCWVCYTRLLNVKFCFYPFLLLFIAYHEAVYFALKVSLISR